MDNNNENYDFSQFIKRLEEKPREEFKTTLYTKVKDNAFAPETIMSMHEYNEQRTSRKRFGIGKMIASIVLIFILGSGVALANEDLRNAIFDTFDPKGSLEIVGEEPDIKAVIFVDGKDYGMLPIQINRIETGNHYIRIQLEGYKDEYKEVVVNAHENTPVVIGFGEFQNGNTYNIILKPQVSENNPDESVRFNMDKVIPNAKGIGEFTVLSARDQDEDKIISVYLYAPDQTVSVSNDLSCMYQEIPAESSVGTYYLVLDEYTSLKTPNLTEFVSRSEFSGQINPVYSDNDIIIFTIYQYGSCAGNTSYWYGYSIEDNTLFQFDIIGKDGLVGDSIFVGINSPIAVDGDGTFVTERYDDTEGIYYLTSWEINTYKKNIRAIKIEKKSE